MFQLSRRIDCKLFLIFLQIAKSQKHHVCVNLGFLGIPLLLLFHLSLMLTSNFLNFHGLHVRVFPFPLLLDPLTVCLQYQPPALLDQGYRDQDDPPAKVPRHELIFGFFGGKQAYL